MNKKIIFFLSTILLCLCFYTGFSRDFFYSISGQNRSTGTLVFTCYKLEKTFPMENIIIWKAYHKTIVALGGETFKYYLLRNGLAYLNHPDKAKPEEREAQRISKVNKLGVWGGKRPAYRIESYPQRGYYYSIDSYVGLKSFFNSYSFYAEFPLENIELWNKYQNYLRPREDLYQNSFRKYLLVNGYARIVDATTAEAEDKNLENTARLSRLGIWAESVTISSKDTVINEPGGINKPEIDPSHLSWWEGFKVWINENKKSWWFIALCAVIPVFISYEFLKDIIKWLIKKLRRKPLKVTVIGAIGSGKTALLTVVQNPNVSKDTIEGLPPSQREAIEAIKIRSAKNNCNIDLHVLATAGTMPNKAVDHIQIDGKQVIVIVVAPNVTLNIANPVHEYVIMQLSTIEMFLATIKAKKTKVKPAKIVLFINKFDLMSTESPFNQSDYAKAKVEFTLSTFKAHIAIIKKYAAEMGITSEVVIGSAYKKWATHDFCNNLINED